MIQKGELQSDVFVYGPPSVQWIHARRSAKVKTAGFDHRGASSLKKRAETTYHERVTPPVKQESGWSPKASQMWQLADLNKIKVPDNLAKKVMKDGKTDYRPKMGDSGQVIQQRKTQSSLSSYFKSGKSLNKAYKFWTNRRAPEQF